METHYVAIIEKETKSDWGIWFPDFDGCVSAGQTTAQAVKEGEAALQAHVDLMLEEGLELPVPSAIEKFFVRGDLSEHFPTLVKVHLPDRTKRLNITIDEALLKRIRAETGNVSQFLAGAARERLKNLHSAE